MIEISDTSTIGDIFIKAAHRYSSRPFLSAPAGSHRTCHQSGLEIRYSEALMEVQRLYENYRSSGFGHGHRVAMLLDNRPEHFLHKIALNSLGISCVPINPDYRASEIAYLLEHSEVDLAIVAGERREQLAAGMGASAHKAPLAIFDDMRSLPNPKRARLDQDVSPQTEASILYTSGTTGRPKGCVLSHQYELESGAWYATRGGLVTFRPEGERLYSPLPVFHVNASVMALQCIIQTGSCQIQTDRFNSHRWWSEINQTNATMVHYLGVIVPMLLSMPPSDAERSHCVRVGVGAGVEPQLHSLFEKRFGFPLVEIWGMTEMVRVLMDHEEPRQVGTRAFGRPQPSVEARVLDERDIDVPKGAPGELVIRHSASTPRRGFFSGYLKDPESTEASWRGGWFHTGDTVRQEKDGMLYFIDRKKNIIRRSGENIAAAEVEAVLQSHHLVKQVAVVAVLDDIREEEVFACVVLSEKCDPDEAANILFAYASEQLAYYKAPGWLLFMESLPITGTQKIQKHQIFTRGIDPRSIPGVLDLRHMKRRAAATKIA